MARRRMINNSIIESPGFYKLTKGAQSLYFHLCTTADDDGFSDRIGMIRRTMNLRKECVSELEKAGFIYSFSPEVALIVHWRSHNLIRGDRAFPSIYKEYRTRVFLRHDGCYVVMPEGLSEEEMSERAARERLKPIASFLVYENTNYGGIDKNREEKENHKIILETELESEPEPEA